ncbi:hypothetical protein T4C_869 [Trichinella pseudospiralis]|uniref:Uncharacterized protein n=1 Tax=Trichinella pseudospiralis TaxID=6337 RepID=A0A0V1ILH6_TRIPS|nr:hypothetical protein T4C_869 [Trichinella pseudospiralis]
MVLLTFQFSSAQRPISLAPTGSENSPLSFLDACTLKRSAQAPGKQNIGEQTLPTPTFLSIASNISICIFELQQN